MYRENLEAGSAAADSPTYDSNEQDAGDVLRHLQPMLTAMASKLSRGDRDLEADYLQDGACAVLTAVSRFNRMKGSAVCYAARFARGSLLNRRRWLAYRQRELAVGAFEDADLEGDGESAHGFRRLAAAAGQSLNQVFDAVDCRLLRDLAYRTLTAMELNAFELVHFEGYRPKEAAVKLRVSAPRITQLVASALTKIRARLPEIALVSRRLISSAGQRTHGDVDVTAVRSEQRPQHGSGKKTV